MVGWLGPGNYEECILDSMKGVTSDLAARAIISSCRNKFPTKPFADSELSSSVIRQLGGQAAMTDYGYFKGTIYNGNGEWTVTQFTVVLTPKTNTGGGDSSSLLRRYKVDVSVPPLSESGFSVLAETGISSDFSWHISEARGHRK
jgi:hypothetical protein